MRCLEHVSPQLQLELLRSFNARLVLVPGADVPRRWRGGPGGGSLNRSQDVEVLTVTAANRLMSPWGNVNAVWNAPCGVTCCWDGSLVASVRPDTSNVAEPEAGDGGEGRGDAWP